MSHRELVEIRLVHTYRQIPRRITYKCAVLELVILQRDTSTLPAVLPRIEHLRGGSPTSACATSGTALYDAFVLSRIDVETRACWEMA